MRPCENVMALSEGVLDVPGLFWRQEGTDIREVSSSSEIWIVCKGSATGGSLSAGLSDCYWSRRGRIQGGVHPPDWFLPLVLSGSIGERLTDCRIGRFAHPCHVRPKMTLKGDKSCTTENCTLRVTGLAWTGSTISPKEVVDDPLNPDKIRPGFSRPDASHVEVSYSRDRMRASRCGCNIRVGSTGGKMIVHLWGEGPPTIPGRMELTCSRTDVPATTFVSFVWSRTPRDLALPAFDRTALAGPEVWHFFPTTSGCLSSNQDLWVAAHTSSSSIEYLLARRNKSSIVVGGFLASDSKNGDAWTDASLEICRTASMLVLMFCLCRAKHKYCPTKASDRSLKLSTELGGAVNVLHHRGDHRVGCAPQVVATGGLGLLGSCGPSLARIESDNWGYIDSRSGLEFATWPLERCDGEAPSMKLYAQHTFSSLNLTSPRGELAVVACLPTVFFRWLGAIQNYLPLPSRRAASEGVAIFAVVPAKVSEQGVRTHPPMVLSAMGDFWLVMMPLGGGRAIITLRAADKIVGGATV
ncbi:hypothetical protein CK203_026372 [Vitis vinifera]|uniref:Uncharacterized protein n=1 Tax=Vitis vinifera TaxID=29760 RepID=A0A438IVN3_VITVI|nr:hypothetical protein CK203_026372 [Vitis vinifera]